MADMADSLLIKLDRLRSKCGFPIVLSSAYRCPEYNNRVSGKGYDAQLGSTAGSDTNDPLFLGYDGTKYAYFLIGGNVTLPADIEYREGNPYMQTLTANNAPSAIVMGSRS